MKTFTISFFIIHFSLFIFHFDGEAQIIHIPADYQTIQEGIAAANHGDTVLVADGLYYENIDFLGKDSLIVASHFLITDDTNHINNTIINGSQPDDPNFGSVVIMQNGEDTTSVLCGFTITGGTGTLTPEYFNNRFGGGVFILYGGKLMNNHIEYNIVSNGPWAGGGGVAILGPSPTPLLAVLRHNRISYNKAISDNEEGSGGGVACFWNLILVDNEILNNEATGSYRGDGGGVYIHGDWGHINLEIRDNKINYNKAASNSDITDIVISGGINVFNDCSGIVANNDIFFNEINVAEGKWSYGSGIMIEQIPSTDLVIENNFIMKNTFNGTYCLGGGVCMYDTYSKFQNNIVRDNSGSHGGGVAVGFNVDKQVATINNTITGNEAEIGGGLYATTAEAVVINTIIWGNTANNGPSIYSNGSSLEVQYSDVEGDETWPGDGNENVDPGFGEDGYHLGETSLVWNEGITATVINGITYECPPYDIDGEPRPWDWCDPEIGADETPSCFVAVEESSVVSRQSSVVCCYPNPTSGIVDFRFSNFDGKSTIDLRQSTILKIYNAQSQEVATILNGPWPVDQVVRWDASGLPAGVYYYQLRAKGEGQVRAGKIVKY